MIMSCLCLCFIIFKHLHSVPKIAFVEGNKGSVFWEHSVERVHPFRLHNCPRYNDSKVCTDALLLGKINF